jgi:hypothetical protein
MLGFILFGVIIGAGLFYLLTVSLRAYVEKRNYEAINENPRRPE